jgi:predicted metal-dependent phosphoesterase TrpH
VKIDLHVHSHYSFDSLITPEEMVTYSKRRGLDGVAITDHDRIDGAKRIARETDFLVIAGIEVTSADGHIVGLNVRESIPPWLGAGETVDKIHTAGGLAVACHPVTLFKGSIGKKTNADFDAVEVINASAIPFRYSIKHAKLMASQLKIPSVAGSDAHYAPEIGCAYTIVASEPNAEEVMKAIKDGLCQPCGGSIPIGTRLKKTLLTIRKRL